MTREDLIKVNAGIIKSVVNSAIHHSPDCTLVIVANPVDAMTYLAIKVSGFARERVVGLSGVLDSARLANFISLEMNVPVADIRCFVLGEHGPSMAVFPRLATVRGRPISELLPSDAIDRLVAKTINGGAEIVSLLKTSSAFFAPAAAAAYMALNILQDNDEIIPCAALLEGEYGLHDVVVGVPLKLGPGGIKEIVEFDLTAAEVKALEASAEAVRIQIAVL